MAQHSSGAGKIPVLGLLGGVGSGKSTLAAVLARLGAVVLDADRCVGELLKDPAVLREIREALGEAVFDAGGAVSRSRLADRIFGSASDREKIERILHPRVRARFKARMESLEADRRTVAIVLDVPLLLGSELRSLCDALVLVKASRAARLARVADARGWNESELARREACQPSEEEKERAADFVIENEGPVEELEARVRSVLAALIGPNRDRN